MAGPEDALIDRDKSLNEGAITFPNFTVGTWYHRIFTDSGFFDNDKPLRDFTDAELERLLHGPEAKVKTELVTLTYEDGTEASAGTLTLRAFAAMIRPPYEIGLWVRQMEQIGVRSLGVASITTIFTEELVSPAIADTVTAEVAVHSPRNAM